jgi:hypothetical protein
MHTAPLISSSHNISVSTTGIKLIIPVDIMHKYASKIAVSALQLIITA